MPSASRFSVFKLKSEGAPAPPPKDPFYARSLFARSATSLAPDSPATPSTPYPPMPCLPARPSPSPAPTTDAASTDSSGSTSARHKKNVFKLASLAKRNRSKKDLSDTASAASTTRSTSASEQNDDDGISLPWNFQHNIHVDEGYIGLPPSWSAALSQVGFDDEEIAAIHARRRAAASVPTPRSTEFPQTISIPDSLPTTLLDPAPRSTSLGKFPHVTPPSVYSNPAPSSRAPSFSMRSMVTGIKHSLSSDSASINGVSSSRPSDAADESDPYIIVDGNPPIHGIANETLIEPYFFDASSVSSDPRDTSQTPRTPTFPQIHVQRAHSDSGHVPFPSTSSRTPSPLVHCTSLPIPTPPRAHLSPSQSLSASSLRPAPLSAPPRTPPRRIYHIANPSSDSYDGQTYPEPPPAYVSPRRDQWSDNKEKQPSVDSPPRPQRPVPPPPTEESQGEPSNNHDRQADPEPQNTSTDPSMDEIPKTADDVLDISSYYSGHTGHGDPEIAPEDPISPIPPLVIDKRMSKFATLPPRISFHQEDNLNDWSESLFTAIGKGKRTSVSIDAASIKNERRRTIRPMSPPLTTASESVAPSVPNMSFGANLTLASRTVEPVEEDEQEQAQDKADHPKEAQPKNTSPPPTLPDTSLGPSRAKDPEPPVSPPSPKQSSIENLPPSPPPKPTPPSKPTPKLTPARTIPPAITLAPPKTNIITGISGRSPVNSLFGKPQPLPVPIPLSQIRAQLRPPPPKLVHPPPTLPLPPLKRALSHPNLQPPQPPPQTQLPPVPTLNGTKHDSAQALSPARPTGDRDSGLSTITVTPATIATAKTEVVRTAMASVIDSDRVSVGESVVEPNGTAPTQGDVPDESMVSEVSGVSLLRDGAQAKWPAPPPPPVELGTEPSARRASRFRTTSLGRVSHLQAMGGVSPTTHSPQGSLDSAETGESAPRANGVKGKPRLAAEAGLLSSTTGTFGGVDAEEGSSPPEDAEDEGGPPATTTPPLLAPLAPYIAPRDPATCFTNLVEIAEGESGSVFAARVVRPGFADGLTARERAIPQGTEDVAIKRIPLPSAAEAEASPVPGKLASVLHELELLRGLEHLHLLAFDGVYVGAVAAAEEEAGSGSDSEGSTAGAVDTALWIRMELMERSLADVIGLVAEGLALQERMIARFASDVLQGLDYLQRQHVAHRDVRSDNLLVNASGVVKLADFSNAIRVDRNEPVVSGPVGVVYWQAPEMRAGPYNALRVDVWSLGATVWELAETVPPFSMPSESLALAPARVGAQWPPLTHPQHYSRMFHDFLKLCGRESAERPCPGELLNTSFVRNACGRGVILQLLSQCRAIEEGMAGS